MGFFLPEADIKVTRNRGTESRDAPEGMGGYTVRNYSTEQARDTPHQNTTVEMSTKVKNLAEKHDIEELIALINGDECADQDGAEMALAACESTPPAVLTELIRIAVIENDPELLNEVLDNTNGPGVNIAAVEAIIF